MNLLDLVIILTFFLFTIQSFNSNFLSEFISLGSFLLAFFISVGLYDKTSIFFENYVKLPHSIALITSFIIIWFLGELVLVLILEIILNQPFLKKFFQKLNFLRFLLSAIRALIFIAILLIVIASFPIQPKLKQTVTSSKLGSIILSQTQNLESPFKNLLGQISQDGFGFITTEPDSNKIIDLGFKTNDFSPNEKLEQQMIDLVNKERSSRGLKILIFDSKLKDLARKHSSDMFERGYFGHFSPEGEDVSDRAAKYQINYLVIGENLAYAPNLLLAHNGLMNSPGHRANILSKDFAKIGIGIEDGSEFGLMITQVFTN
ncbi:CvpA family protein [Candidatus Daviesbacteria bacterium]|nr:CvpA family protein [Candidatus Daviesbacteria bacterium]